MSDYKTLSAFEQVELHKQVEELQAAKVQIAMKDEALKDFANNYDCDSDAHKYGTICRACEAQKVRLATSADAEAWLREEKAKVLHGIAEMPIKWYVSEREARFVFASTEKRDEFVKVVIGAELPAELRKNGGR